MTEPILFADSILPIIEKSTPEPEREPYWLFGTDGTSAPRQYARTLADRGYVYRPNAIKGNTPVTIGHSYSILAHLPEKQEGDPPWVVPLTVRRVETQETDITVGLEQLALLITDDSLPWHGGMNVQMLDTKYSTPEYLHGAADYENLVLVPRLRSNRTLYLPPPPTDNDPSVGHPTWFGEPFKLKDGTTWTEPDEIVEIPYTCRWGQHYKIRIENWDEMLMRGTRDAPMHEHPFRLVHVTWLDEQGQKVFKCPMWLAVFGEPRLVVSQSEIDG